MTDPTHICKLCEQPVEVDIRFDDESTFYESWTHVEDSDHGPIPVPIDNMNTCEACGVPTGGSAYLYTVAPFTIRAINQEIIDSGSDWEICAGCNRCILTGEWEELDERARNVLRATWATNDLPAEVEEALRAMHLALRHNWDGQPGVLVDTTKGYM